MKILIPVDQAEALRRGESSTNSTATIDVDPTQLSAPEREMLANSVKKGYKVEFPNGIGCPAPTMAGLRETLRYMLRDESKSDLSVAGFIDDVLVNENGSVAIGISCCPPYNVAKGIGNQTEEGLRTLVTRDVPSEYSIQFRTTFASNYSRELIASLEATKGDQPSLAKLAFEDIAGIAETQCTTGRALGIRVSIFIVAPPSIVLQTTLKKGGVDLLLNKEIIRNAQDLAVHCERVMHTLKAIEASPSYLKRDALVCEFARIIHGIPIGPNQCPATSVGAKSNFKINDFSASPSPSASEPPPIKLPRGIFSAGSTDHAILSVCGREYAMSWNHLWLHTSLEGIAHEIITTIEPATPTWSPINDTKCRVTTVLHVWGNAANGLLAKKVTALLHTWGEPLQGQREVRLHRETSLAKDLWLATMPGYIGDALTERASIMFRAEAYKRIPFFGSMVGVRTTYGCPELLMQGFSQPRNIPVAQPGTIVISDFREYPIRFSDYLEFNLMRLNPSMAVINIDDQAADPIMSLYGGENQDFVKMPSPTSFYEGDGEEGLRSVIDFILALVQSTDDTGLNLEPMRKWLEEAVISVARSKGVKMTLEHVKESLLAFNSQVCVDLANRISIWTQGGRFSKYFEPETPKSKPERILKTINMREEFKTDHSIGYLLAGLQLAHSFMGLTRLPETREPKILILNDGQQSILESPFAAKIVRIIAATAAKYGVTFVFSTKHAVLVLKEGLHSNAKFEFITGLYNAPKSVGEKAILEMYPDYKDILPGLREDEVLCFNGGDHAEAFRRFDSSLIYVLTNHGFRADFFALTKAGKRPTEAAAELMGRYCAKTSDSSVKQPNNPTSLPRDEAKVLG